MDDPMYDLRSEVGADRWSFEGRSQVVETVMDEYLPKTAPGAPDRLRPIDIGCPLEPTTLSGGSDPERSTR